MEPTTIRSQDMNGFLAGLRAKLKPTCPRGTSVSKMSGTDVIRAAARIRLVDAPTVAMYWTGQQRANKKKGKNVPAQQDTQDPCLQWTDLPNDVVVTIMERVVAYTHKQPDVVLNMMATCKMFRDFFRSPESLPMWTTIWNGVKESRPHVCDYARSPTQVDARDFHRVVALTSSIGCTRCGAPRIRKVTWEFEVRFCQPCLTTETIGAYRIENTGLPKEQWVDLPHIKKDIYNPYGRLGYREYTLTLYMRRDIDRVVRTQHGDQTFVAFATRKEEEATRKREEATREREESARHLAAHKAEQEAIRDARERRMRGMIEVYVAKDNTIMAHLVWSAKYARNAKLHSNLDEKAFAKKIPDIVEEVKEAIKKKASEDEDAQNKERRRIELETKKTAQNHVVEQKNDKRNKQFECRICQRFFTSERGVFDHTRAKHG
jgi:hypothetical protein